MKITGFSLHRNRLFQIAVVAIVVLVPLRRMGFRDTLGPSMHPKFPSPITFVRAIKADNLKEGDIIAFRRRGILGVSVTSVKWAKIIQPTQDGNYQVYVEGDNKDRSGDSRDFGWLSDTEIEGKVVWAWPSTSTSVSPLFRYVPPPADGNWLASRIAEDLQQPVSVVARECKDWSGPDTFEVKGSFRARYKVGDTIVLRGEKETRKVVIRSITTSVSYNSRQHKVGVSSLVSVKGDPNFQLAFAYFLCSQRKITIE